MKKIANFSSIFKGYKKYLVVGGVFTIYMLFFDNASFLVHRNMNSELDKLTRQKQFLQKEIEKDKKELEALYTDEGKEKLGSANYNKIQNDTSAAMIIVLGDLNHYGKFDEIYGEAVEKGYMTKEVKDGFEKGMGPQLENLPTDKNREGVYFDCGLWTMQFANIAYAKGYDTNIIGGFVREKVAELFELEENLIPVMLIALGKKEKEARPTVRMKAENLVRFE